MRVCVDVRARTARLVCATKHCNVFFLEKGPCPHRLLPPQSSRFPLTLTLQLQHTGSSVGRRRGRMGLEKVRKCA